MTDREATNREILTGPAGSGKTELLLARHRKALATGEIGAALWISPTHRSAAEVRARLLADGFRGCLRPGVMTFSQFAEQILSASSTQVQPITNLVKRQIVRRLILSRGGRPPEAFWPHRWNERADGPGLRIDQRVEDAGDLAG